MISHKGLKKNQSEKIWEEGLDKRKNGDVLSGFYEMMVLNIQKSIKKLTNF